MEPVITPLDSHNAPRHGWITVAFVITYLVFAGLALSALFFLSSQRDDLKNQVQNLETELNKKTAGISQSEAGLSVEGDLNVVGSGSFGGDLSVSGVGFFNSKVNVGSPLVVKRAAATAEYLLQFKTVNDINWSLGVNPQNKATDKNALNLYNGGGLNDPIMTVGTNGQFTYRNANNSAAAFVIQNAAKADLFAADTLTARIVIGGALETETLRVGSGSSVSKLFFGTCSINPASIAAGTNLTVVCEADGVDSTDRVFVNPPGSLNEDLDWQLMGAGSSDTIEIRLRNEGLVATDDSSRTWSWFAIR